MDDDDDDREVGLGRRFLVVLLFGDGDGGVELMCCICLMYGWASWSDYLCNNDVI